MDRGSKRQRAYLILALVLPVFAVAPLFYPGYMQTHSGFIPLWRVVSWRAGLGLPPVALPLDPLRGAGWLPHYLAGLLPLGPVAAVKTVLGLGLLLGSLGLFLWLRPWLGQSGALIAALVYTYLPYRLAALYVRGAWGETLLWGLLPWAMLALVPLAEGGRARRLGVFLAWLLLGLSQLGLALLSLVLGLALWVVVNRRSGWSGLAALIGVGAAAGVSLALARPQPPPVPFEEHFLYPFQLVSAYWGFGPSRPGWDDGLSLQVGLAAVGLALLSLVLWQGRTDRRLPAIPGMTGLPPTISPLRGENSPASPPVGGLPAKAGIAGRLLFFWGAAGGLVLLTLGLAAPLWRLTGLAALLTYPWQVLGLAGLSLAVLAGAALRLDRQLTRLPLFGAMIIFVILSSYPYLLPQFEQAAFYLEQPGPQARLGQNRLALLDHHFLALVESHAAGLEPGQAALPLRVYGPPRPGDTLRLDVTWQPLRPFGQDWKVFVHLVDAQGRVLAQFDGPPRSGQYPTSAWIPGELVEDAYLLLLPPELPPGPYRVFLGLYDEASLARLPVPGDSEGRVILDVE